MRAREDQALAVGGPGWVEEGACLLRDPTRVTRDKVSGARHCRSDPRGEKERQGEEESFHGARLTHQMTRFTLARTTQP